MLKKLSIPPLLMSVWSFATVLGISKDQMRSSSLNKNYMEEQTKPRIIGIWNDILEIYRHGYFFIIFQSIYPSIRFCDLRVSIIFSFQCFKHKLLNYLEKM